MKMCCSFVYCLYNKELRCILNAVEINSLGMCEQCIVISLSEELLEKEKERQRLNLETMP